MTDRDPTAGEVTCGLCAQPIPTDDVDYAKCYGCGLNVCEPCAMLEIDSPMGPHGRQDHIDARDPTDA